MKVANLDNVPANLSDNPLFTGGPVSIQDLVIPPDSEHLRAINVSFAKGARNKFHSHSTDQILIVVSGRGIVATESEERVVTVGDVILFRAGEKHWHGATPDSAFAHIAITPANTTLTQLED